MFYRATCSYCFIRRLARYVLSGDLLVLVYQTTCSHCCIVRLAAGARKSGAPETALPRRAVSRGTGPCPWRPSHVGQGRGSPTHEPTIQSRVPCGRDLCRVSVQEARRVSCCHPSHRLAQPKAGGSGPRLACAMHEHTPPSPSPARRGAADPRCPAPLCLSRPCRGLPRRRLGSVMAGGGPGAGPARPGPGRG